MPKYRFEVYVRYNGYVTRELASDDDALDLADNGSEDLASDAADSGWPDVEVEYVERYDEEKEKWIVVDD